MAVTLRDVARESGVSISVVSRSFLDGSPVAAPTRARVLAAARRLGYQRNRLAAGLTTGELEELRGAFVAANPRQQARAQIQVARSRAFTSAGDSQRALSTLEVALAEDPLSLELHQAYWALKRRISGTPARGSRV